MAISSVRGATACGLLALLVWSCAPGLMRSVAQAFGTIGGAALSYSLGAVLLLALFGRPRLRRSSPMYLVVGSALFVIYEVCLALALGYANTSEQSIQVGVVNSLWPCLTVLLAIVMNGQSARWIIVPGMALALVGMTSVVSAQGLSLESFARNIQSNPLSYSLALICSISFALYCNVTRRYAQGENHVALFFVLTAIALWVKYAFSSEVLPAFAWRPSLELIALAISLGGGYALWNIGILRGNLTLLATLSYFSPVMTSGFATLWLGASLPLPFWNGVVLVCVGSLLCWYATRARTASAS